MVTEPVVEAETASPDLLSVGLLVSLVGILLVAVLAARLLGVRRSLLGTLLSGLVGWIAGVGLSTVIAQSQPDPTAGFTRNVWVFSTIFAMAATVFAELLIRPGALARAQSGLSRVPRPLRALRLRAQRISRYAQITGIALRHGLGPVLGLSGARRGRAKEDVAESTPTGRRLRLALEEAGGVFLKLGQVLSTRSDLLPRGCATSWPDCRTRFPPPRRRACARYSRPRSDRSMRCSPSSTGSRWAPPPSARPTGRCCIPGRPSWSRCSVLAFAR